MTQSRTRDTARFRRARRVAHEAPAHLERRNPVYPAQLTLLVAIALGLLLPGRMTIGRPWFLPAGEAAVLLALFVTTERHPDDEDPWRRRARVALVAFVSAANLFALIALVQALLEGGAEDGRPLLVGGAVLWLTAVLLFGIWFWELDRGGPIRRLTGNELKPDFLYVQESDLGWEGWRPGITDYLYVSLTNASSFSTSEDMTPVTQKAKVLLSLQTLASLLTTTIVVAYAVNNLS
jgi:hypothetical protein